MINQEQQRRKTRSQLVDDQKQVSRQQIPSQNNLDAVQHYSDIDSSKLKQQKQLPTRKSNWNKKQKIKYFVFLNYYSDLPHWSSDLKSIPTYKTLSLFVKSRSPQQCKSFHLSTRRNYKSVEEEMKALQEELQQEQGYQKMLDRYQFEIIAFEEEHKILPGFDLEQKKYFHNKFLQKCKQTGFNKDLNPDQESIQQHQPDYNPRINIMELIKEKQVQDKKKQDKFPTLDQYQPLINMRYDNMPKQGNNYINPMNPNMIQPNPNIPMPNAQHNVMSYFGQQNSFNPNDPSKPMDKYSMENMRQQQQTMNASNQPSNYGNRNFPNPNERIMQENLNRMMEAKNVFAQYPNYGQYGSNPFGGMNQMHMAQFRNQLPFTMAPPGGIPYMIPSYPEPYGMPNMQSRYGPTVEDQNDKSKGNRNQSQNMQPPVADKNRTQNIEQKQTKVYSQKRKELLLNCHQHWVNWLRAVTQLNKRKQMGRNLVTNNNQ